MLTRLAIENKKFQVPAQNETHFFSFLENIIDSVLDERERIIVKERFGLEDGVVRLYRDLGRTLDVSEGRIKRLEERAIAKLRSKGREIRGFLTNHTP